jgi:hypothetical protein
LYCQIQPFFWARAGYLGGVDVVSKLMLVLLRRKLNGKVADPLDGDVVR